MQVLAVVGLVEREPGDAELLPDDIGVVLPPLRQLERLGEPGADAFLQDGLLALGELARGVLLFELLELGFELGLLLQGLDPALPPPRVRIVSRLGEPPLQRLLLLAVGLLALLLLHLGVAPLELDLALDRRDPLDEPEHRLLVHLRARERLVGDDRHIELAALEPRPLAAALLGRVGLARLQALAQPAREGLLVEADDHHAEVGQGLTDVVDPLERDGLRDDDHRAARAPGLPRQRERSQDGERLADTDVEAEPTTMVGVEAPRAGDLMGVEDNRGVPARELERLAAVAVGAVALTGALVALLDDPLALRLGLAEGPETLGPLSRVGESELVDVLVFAGVGLEDDVIVVDPPEAEERLLRERHQTTLVVFVGDVGEVHEALVADQVHGLSMVEGGEPGFEQRERDEPVLRRDLDLVERRRSDDLQESTRLRSGLHVAEPAARVGAIELRPELAIEVLVRREQLAAHVEPLGP